MTTTRTPRAGDDYHGRRANGAITVWPSLTEAFTHRDGFPEGEPGRNSDSTRPSGTPATQIQQGALADTFASADEANKDKLTSANLVDGEPVAFATNKLVIVTKPDNPKDVKTWPTWPPPVVSLCADTVPCGKYAADPVDRRDDP
jgi:molybdate transport system substrate-binding protein